MNQRDRLIELLMDTETESVPNKDGFYICHLSRVKAEVCADYLLTNGVIVPPCKVGDTVYVVSRYYAGYWEFYKCKIDNITIYEKNTFISCVANDARFGKINFGLNISELGKTVFLTKEEAEAELRKRSENNAKF